MKASKDYHGDLLKRLEDPAYAAAYLNACLNDGDDGVFLLALRDVAQAHGGVAQLAKKTRLNREHLFRLLSKTGNPQLHSLQQIVGALGLKFTLRPA
jgi:probable addiction module antidote protein